MGGASSSEKDTASSSEWTTTEIRDGQPVPSSNKTKNNKTKNKTASIPTRSESEWIEFYTNDRRFVAVSNEANASASASTLTTVRVMTYNILADGKRYALSDRHSYCNKQLRAWPYRFQCIKAQLKAYAPDIVCLQETTPSSWKNQMQRPLEAMGYSGVHAVRDPFDAKHLGATQSDCVLWKADKFRLIKHTILRLRQFVRKGKPKQHKQDPNYPAYDAMYDEWLGDPKSMFRSFCGACLDVVIVLHFQCNQTLKEFIVCSSHFYWDPKNPEIKAQQALVLNVELERLLTKDEEWKWRRTDESEPDEKTPSQLDLDEPAVDINSIPIIFGADLNSLPWKDQADEFDSDLPQGQGFRSGVYELMSTGVLPRSHRDHPYARIQSREQRLMKVHEPASGVHTMSQKELEYVGELCDWRIALRWTSVYAAVNKRNQCKEPVFTNRIPSFSDTLDYLFVSEACGIAAFLEMPWQKQLTYHRLPTAVRDEEDKEDAKDGKQWIDKEIETEQQLCQNFPYLPNAEHPSDHLPLCADIVIN